MPSKQLSQITFSDSDPPIEMNGHVDMLLACFSPSGIIKSHPTLLSNPKSDYSTASVTHSSLSLHRRRASSAPACTNPKTPHDNTTLLTPPAAVPAPCLQQGLSYPFLQHHQHNSSQWVYDSSRHCVRERGGRQILVIDYDENTKIGGVQKGEADNGITRKDL